MGLILLGTALSATTLLFYKASGILTKQIDPKEFLAGPNEEWSQLKTCHSLTGLGFLISFALAACVDTMALGATIEVIFG